MLQKSKLEKQSLQDKLGIQSRRQSELKDELKRLSKQSSKTKADLDKLQPSLEEKRYSRKKSK
eukprot:UN16476